MAVAPFKTYIAGEVLTAADLNASLLQIHNGGIALVSPATAAFDMDAFELILDADADSSLRANTDDRLDLKLNGVVLFRWNGTVVTPVNGLDFIASATLVAPQITAVGTDTNIDVNIVPKGSGAFLVNGVPIGQSSDNVLAMRTFA